MKIISGGGGVDVNGKAYTLPETEVEVPDDYFKQLSKAIVAEKKKEQPLVWLVNPDIYEILKR